MRSWERQGLAERDQKIGPAGQMEEKQLAGDLEMPTAPPCARTNKSYDADGQGHVPMTIRWYHQFSLRLLVKLVDTLANIPVANAPQVTA